jgi:hypothetical protein
MKVKLGIFEDKQYTQHGPFAPKTVIVHTKVSEREEEIPDDIAGVIAKAFFFNADVYCEGVAQIIMQDPETGAIGRQGVRFILPEEVKDQKTAFDKFDEAVNAFLEKAKEREQNQENHIERASEEDLRLINKIRDQAKKKGRIEIP